MNISFALEINAGEDSSKEVSVLIRCTLQRKHRRMATGITVAPKYWDSTLKKIKGRHPYAKEYNDILLEKMRRVTRVYADLLSTKDEVNLDDLASSFYQDNNQNFFDFAYSSKMTEIKNRKKLGTYRRYETVLNKLKDYAGSKLSLNRITYSFLKEYSLYLQAELENGEDTVSANLSVIRSVINEAIRHGKYTQRNPFDQLKLRYTDNTKEKLTAEELNRIFTTTLPKIPSLLLSRDFFLSCFLAEGTRAGDMMLMRNENIQKNCLVFCQTKTGQQMVIPIVRELQEIFDRYEDVKKGYLFPFLKDAGAVNEVTVNSKITFVNKYLKELAKYCGIFKKLSTHVARHTFTDLALQVTDGNIYKVQQSLGHTSVKTTELYSRNRVNYEKAGLIVEILKEVEDKKALK